MTSKQVVRRVLLLEDIAPMESSPTTSGATSPINRSLHLVKGTSEKKKKKYIEVLTEIYCNVIKIVIYVL